MFLQDYQPSTAPTTSSSPKESRELCALCSCSLMEHLPGGAELGLDKGLESRLESDLKCSNHSRMEHPP